MTVSCAVVVSLLLSEGTPLSAITTLAVAGRNLQGVEECGIRDMSDMSGMSDMSDVSGMRDMSGRSGMSDVNDMSDRKMQDIKI